MQRSRIEPSGDSSQEEIKRLTAQVKEKAIQLGFDLVGVTTPDPPPHLDVYEGWIAEGRHGEMAYLATDRARHRRGDPRRVLPECRSILVVAANYLPSPPHAAEPTSSAKVAAYAQGDDYHEVLVDRLRELVGFLEGTVGTPVPNRIYADTGPLLERELAQRAGLGWIGKNTCLIHPRKGSYLLLAEVLLGIPLHPDGPMTSDHCGACTLCIQACPTECILPDRTLDAVRCISYLTIELKGEIPAELRSQTGDWVFGCDICQQVCPWNVRFAAPTLDSAFQPRLFLEKPAILDFLEMDAARYRRQLKDSPLKRPKRRGLMRNACVAAGNSRGLPYVAALSRILLKEQDAQVRAHAAWALGQIGGKRAIRALRHAEEREASPEAREEIESALDQARRAEQAGEE